MLICYLDNSIIFFVSSVEFLHKLFEVLKLLQGWAYDRAVGNIHEKAWVISEMERTTKFNFAGKLTYFGE